MLGVDNFLSSSIPLAYAGPGAGLELIPYFLGFLAWAGVALGAVLLWPVTALIRRLRGIKDDPGAELNQGSSPQQISASPATAVPASPDKS